MRSVDPHSADILKLLAHKPAYVHTEVAYDLVTLVGSSVEIASNFK